jgi:hypothetical protein
MRMAVKGRRSGPGQRQPQRPARRGPPRKTISAPWGFKGGAGLYEPSSADRKLVRRF